MIFVSFSQILTYLLLYYVQSYSLIMIEDGECHKGLNISSDGRKCIHIGGTFPMSGGWPGGQGCLPSALMALKDINDRKDVLPGYYIKFHYNDSKCHPGLGTRIMYDLLYNEPTKIVLMTGCSSVSTTLAEAAPMWNLVVISYGSSSPALSNRKRFPTFFRTHPSQSLHNPTRIKLFKMFGWQRIAILQELQELFTSTAEDLETRLKASGMEVMTRQSFINDPSDAVKNLKRQDARIIVAIFYDNHAQNVFCEVYKNGLYGKRYVWFILGWYADNWFENAEANTNCTSAQLAEVLNYHFSIESLMLNQDETVTVSGRTAQQFLTKLKDGFKEKNIDPNTVSGVAEAPLAYDAVWALAFALNRTMFALKPKGLYLENFTYPDTYISKVIYDSMSQTKFFGVSGMVTFTDSGDRIAWTLVEQMIRGSYRKLAFYHQYDNNLTWLNTVEWPGNGPPPDRTRIVPKLLVISPKLFIGVCIMSGIGIIGAIGCLMFNRLFGHRRIIIRSMPWINNVLLVGNIMCLISAILFGLDGRLLPHSYTTLCQTRLWIISFGYSLAYGALFTKVWKVNNMRGSVKKEIEKTDSRISDYWIPIFLVADLILLGVWQAVDPLHRTLQDFHMTDLVIDDDDVKILPQLERCYCKKFNVWIVIYPILYVALLYGTKGLFLLFGLFLSYEIRRLTIKNINDSKFVGVAIYNIAVLCLITIPMTILIVNNHNACYAFVATSIVVSCFLSTCLIFLPKIYQVWKWQTDEEPIDTTSGNLLSKEEEDKYQQLVTENDDIQKQIQEKDTRIKELSDMLRQRVMNKQSIPKLDHTKNRNRT